MPIDILISSIVVDLVKLTLNLLLRVRHNLGQVRLLESPALGKLTPNVLLRVKQNLGQVQLLGSLALGKLTPNLLLRVK